MTDTVPVTARPRVAVPCGCVLGEAPMWDARSGTLYWVDIKSFVVYRWRPDEDAPPRQYTVGEPVGFVKLTPDPDRVILGLKTGLVRFGLADERVERLLTPEPDHPGNRLNDAGVGPDGSLYFGSMDDGETRPTGSFYRWSLRGLERFGPHAVVTNGPSVDGLRRVVYTVDTTARQVFRHDLGVDGVPGDARPFVTFEQGSGHPDGLTIDAEGHVWICHWGGSRVTRFDPAGRPILEIPMPTSKVTKAAFGGPDLATMYITTASIGQDRETDLQAGHLFAIETGIRGLEAELCRMPPTNPA